MNKNMNAILPLLVILFFSVFMFGCVNQTSTNEIKTTPTVENNITNITQNQSNNQVTPSTEFSLSDMFTKTSSIKSVKYDSIITAQGSSVTQKVWLKEKKMKVETLAEGERIVTIINMDESVMYSYMPSQNIAFKTPFDYNQPISSPLEPVNDYKPIVIGSETIDGKDCVILQYSIEGVQTKAWYWKEKGFPIKLQMTTQEGVSTIEYKNIEFTNIDDSEFTLPAGVQIIG